MRKAKKKEPRSPLQAIFIRRIQEEMTRQDLSGNALAQRVGAPPQRTIADVLNGADPKLETVNAFSVALGVQPIELLTEARSAGNIRHLPTYPPMIGQQAKVERNFATVRKRKRV